MSVANLFFCLKGKIISLELNIYFYKKQAALLQSIADNYCEKWEVTVSLTPCIIFLGRLKSASQMIKVWRKTLNSAITLPRWHKMIVTYFPIKYNTINNQLDTKIRILYFMTLCLLR